MLNENNTIGINIEENEGFLDFLNIKKFNISENDPILWKVRLGSILSMKQMDSETFIREFYDFQGMKNTQLHYTSENKDYSIYGRIPCVVQLPIQENLDEKYPNKNIYNIALAEFGSDWLNQAFSKNDPQILIGTGIEGLINKKEIMEGNYGFNQKEYTTNKDFDLFKDPKGKFGFLAAIPLVMVIDRTRAEGRRIPVSFEQLLDEELEKSIVYPDDGHMLDSIMISYIYKIGKEDAVKKFKKNTIRGVHPSQMIKVNGIEERPYIFIMPWIFGSIKAREENMELRWFEDGAPIIPLIITYKNNLDPSKKEMLDYLLGKEIGSIFRGQGFFPASAEEIDNKLPGILNFIGWDYLYKENILEIISVCKSIMEEKE